MNQEVIDARSTTHSLACLSYLVSGDTYNLFLKYHKLVQSECDTMTVEMACNFVASNEATNPSHAVTTVRSLPANCSNLDLSTFDNTSISDVLIHTTRANFRSASRDRKHDSHNRNATNNYGPRNARSRERSQDKQNKYSNDSRRRNSFGSRKRYFNDTERKGNSGSVSRIPSRYTSEERRFHTRGYVSQNRDTNTRQHRIQWK